MVFLRKVFYCLSIDRLTVKHFSLQVRLFDKVRSIKFVFVLITNITS